MTLTPAPFGKRFAAALIDGVLVSLVIAVLLALVTGVSILTFSALSLSIGADLEEGSIGTSQVAFAGIFVVIIVIVIVVGLHGYYVYFETKRGQTPGKKFFRLRVVDISGGPLTRRQAITRDMFRWYVDGLFIVPAIVSLALTTRRQRVGDLAAKTVVISE